MTLPIIETPIIETLGCRLNTYESQVMQDLCQDAGVQNTIIVNTCAVTAAAVRTSRQKIRKLRKAHPDARLVVTGCAAQIAPDSYAKMAEVDVVLGNHEKMQASSWAALKPVPNITPPDFIGTQEKIKVNDISAVRETASHLLAGFDGRARAYVQVQNGCDHRCTFCIIPYGRGPSRSTPAGFVIEQIQRLVDNGFNEVVLTGVDMTSWGADLPGQPRLGDLVQKILRHVAGLARLRLSSIDSIEADPALIDAMKSERRFMPHIHMSLQSGDNMILKRMKRRHCREDAIDFCTRVRTARPDIVFGADIIAGFPTETEAMFKQSCDLVAECGLTWLHVFGFSAREGTPAARMPQLPADIIKERSAVLRGLGEAARVAHFERQVGSVRSVLMESDNRGRCEDFSEVMFATPQARGQIVSAKIIGYDEKTLLA